MIPIIFRNPDLGDKPGMHALIVGVSNYEFLPEANAPASAEIGFGMRKLTSTALTALEIYQWLMQAHQDGKLQSPLASVRLLLSPSDSELQDPRIQEIEGKYATASLENFQRAANGWRADAAMSRASSTFFYFAGHGIQRTRGDQVLLLEGFGEPDMPILQHATDSYSLRAGMGPSNSRPDISRTQFYFVDACRNYPAQIANFEGLSVPSTFDVEVPTYDDRCAPIIYATVPSGQTEALQGRYTLFCKAFLQCMKCDAIRAREDDGPGTWYVSYHTLADVLDETLSAINDQYGTDQKFTLDGFGTDAVLCIQEEPPMVPLVLLVNPETACPITRVKVVNWVTQVSYEFTQGSPYPYNQELPAGYYRLQGVIDPQDGNFNDFSPPQPYSLLPPKRSWEVKV